MVNRLSLLSNHTHPPPFFLSNKDLITFSASQNTACDIYTTWVSEWEPRQRTIALLGLYDGGIIFVRAVLDLPIASAFVH